MSADKYIPKSCGPVKNTFTTLLTKLYAIYTSNVYHLYMQGLKRVPYIELDIWRVTSKILSGKENSWEGILEMLEICTWVLIQTELGLIYCYAFLLA